MKKLLSVLFAVALLVGCMIPFSAVSANTPTGTAITTVDEFVAMTDGNYYLANDLDFTGKGGTTIGSGDTAAAAYANYVVASFSGTLDGNGKTIKNVNIAATEDGGIFRSVAANANTVIKNLVVENVNITLQTEAGLNNVGVLAGYQGGVPADDPLQEAAPTYTLTIENVAVQGSMSGMARAVGGLLGIAKDVTVRNTHTTGLFTIEDGAGKYTRRIGGFFGETRMGIVEIYSSSNSVELVIPAAPGYKAHMSIGGFIGVFGGSENERDTLKLQNCVNFGNIDNGNASRNQHQVGGFVALSLGKATAANVISGCVNFAELIGGYWNGGIIGWNAYSKYEIKDCIIYGTQDFVGETNGGAPYIAFKADGDVIAASCLDKRDAVDNSDAVDTVEIVAAQESAAASNKFNVRLVAGLASPETCKKIGFEIITYVKSGDSYSVKSVEKKECSYVFTTLLADSATGISETYTAADFGVKALYALTIEGAPAAADNGLFVIVARPYTVDANDKTEYGQAVAAAYDAGVFCGIGYAY